MRKSTCIHTNAPSARMLTRINPHVHTHMILPPGVLSSCALKFFMMSKNWL